MTSTHRAKKLNVLEQTGINLVPLKTSDVLTCLINMVVVQTLLDEDEAASPGNKQKKKNETTLGKQTKNKTWDK